MSALTEQVGGSHYKDCKIQPIQYIEANKLSFLEACVVKRVTRHDKPTGKGRQDIEKAIHELQLLLELRYGVGPGVMGESGSTGYTKCPHCKELTRAAPGCLSNVCDQCKRVFGFGGTIGAFSEERMDVIGQNGNEGAHYEKDWVTHDGGPCPVPSGLKVEYKLRAGVKSDKPWPVEGLTWQHGGYAAPWEIVAYRLA